jgi:predicted DNA-binding transcriptional regulator AlpA
MASIQIAIDSPYVTKEEFLRRTGMKSSTFDHMKKIGQIPIKPKDGLRSLVLVNMIKWAEEAALQQV